MHRRPIERIKNRNPVSTVLKPIIMKKRIKTFIEELGKKNNRPAETSDNLTNLSASLEKQHIHLHSKSLHKLLGYLSGREKPSRKTLDRLALFAGFQNWKDLKSALHGECDAQVNYED